MDYSKKKLNELRNICKDFKLKSSGKKKDMIKRLEHYHFLEKRIEKKIINLYPYNEEYYRSLQSYEKFYSLLIRKSSGDVSAKLNNQTNKIEDLTKDDLKYCYEQNYPVSIPIYIKGEYDTHRIRNIIEEEEENDQFEEEI